MVSTRLLLEGPDVEALLTRVRDEHGPDVRIVNAEKVRSGGFAGFFARERYAMTIEVGDVASTASEGPNPPRGDERPVDEPGTLLELADAIDTAEAAEAQVIMSTATKPRVAVGSPAGPFGASTTALQGGAGALSTESPAFAAVLARLSQAGTMNGSPGDDADRRCSEVVRRLLALGLPREIAQKVDGSGADNLRDSLIRALAVLPVPPATDLQAGDVLVIAGAGAAAYDVACAVARRMRLDPTRVLLAAPSALGTGINPARRMSGPTEARRRSARLQRSDVPTIVAVDSPCDGESGVWARKVADALGARAVWALVDATSKPADLLDHLVTLGRLDGLAVRATGASRDPASVLRPALDLCLPTVLLEGRRGDAAAWASLLLERLGETG